MTLRLIWRPTWAGTTPRPASGSRAEKVLQLVAALRRLPEDQRTAIEQHHLRGLTVPEVARRMEKTVAAVTGLLYRGGKALSRPVHPVRSSVEALPPHSPTGATPAPHPPGSG